MYRCSRLILQSGMMLSYSFPAEISERDKIPSYRLHWLQLIVNACAIIFFFFLFAEGCVRTRDREHILRLSGRRKSQFPRVYYARCKARPTLLPRVQCGHHGTLLPHLLLLPHLPLLLLGIFIERFNLCIFVY